MKLRHLVFATSVVLTSLACGGLGGSAMTGMPSVSVAEPWSSMSLPIGDGNVVFSEATSMTIMYSSGTVADYAAQYESAITGAGWSQTYRSDDAGSITVLYSKDGQTMTLSVLESLGQPMVALTLS
jgi:hypothetical protein